jgi:hypothetical protein
MDVTVTVDEERLQALAGVLEVVANERLTPSGRRTLSLNPKGDYKWKDEFRRELLSLSEQLRKAAN